MPPLSLIIKAIRELGPMRIGQYALYQAGVRSGYYRFRTRVEEIWNGSLTLEAVRLPARTALERILGPKVDWVVEAAGEIAAGTYRQWGGDPVPLKLLVPGPLEHWTAYEGGRFNGRDIKYTWEPARFGWAITLARAYILTGDAAIAETFHRYLQDFLESNPLNRGPNWASAQEVALRLLSLVIAFRVFPQPTNAAKIIAAHAARIPPTLLYARAQNNNHLLSEAVGLYTAGIVLPDHPQAGSWRELGWRLLNGGLQTQIAEDGVYMQQSTNYHRVMLQLALWGQMVSSAEERIYPEKTRTRLAAATRWLHAITDPQTGRVPNLGPNDGAYLLPFTLCDFDDYRPVVQAASNIFLDKSLFQPGLWDEMGLWFADSSQLIESTAPRLASTPSESAQPTIKKGPIVIHHPSLTSRAYFRTAQFTDRPGHADQLHVDLWWRGVNVARDPGTYLYNEAPPWQNALTSAAHHNTITINGRDQMTRAGRFLYVDRAQAHVIEHEDQKAIAEHDGYRTLGISTLR